MYNYATKILRLSKRKLSISDFRDILVCLLGVSELFFNKYMEEFRSYERKARERRIGLWK